MADLRIEPQDLPDGPLLPGGIRPGPGTGHSRCDVGVVEGAAGAKQRAENFKQAAGYSWANALDVAETLAADVLALVADREALLAERDDLAIRADERRIMCDEKDETIKRQTRRVQTFREAVWEHLIHTGDDGHTASGYRLDDIPDELLYDAIVDESARVGVLEGALRDADAALFEFFGEYAPGIAHPTSSHFEALRAAFYRSRAVLAGGEAAPTERPIVKQCDAECWQSGTCSGACEAAGGEAAGQGEEQARALDAACTPDSTGEADFRTDDDFGQGEEES